MRKEVIENLAWVLPRPGEAKYVGSFPLHFEKKLLRLLGVDPDDYDEQTLKELILHPFGGMARYGFRVDLRPEVAPDLVCDAHQLPSNWDEKFCVVILDPPYSEEYSERLYGTQHVPLRWKQYTQEAARVCKEKGYIVSFHEKATPPIEGTLLVKRIFLEHRVWHALRCVHIHQKDTEEYARKGRLLRGEKDD